MAFTPDEKDLEYNLDGLTDLKFNMEEAIGHVFNNEYILIVGNEVMLKPSVEKSGDIFDYLLRHINRNLKADFKNFDEVMQNTGNEIDPIRNLLSWTKFKQSMLVDDVSEELQGLLRTKLFKVVITTTFDSYLEILMRDIWGQDDQGNDRFRKVNIWDQTSIQAFEGVLKEYREPKDYNEPTIIYAFGKCEEREGLIYARKDFEYIQTIERWMKLDNRSDVIIEFIKSKRILSLGCKFENWYFRFFLYILKREERKHREGDIVIAFNPNDRYDQKLETYLKNLRVITQTEMTSREFMSYITKTLTSVDVSNPYRNIVTKFRRRGTIFFSYCNKDKILARQIFLHLCRLYPNLWFDQENVLGGDNYDKEIRYAIGHAKVFVPLLTPQIAEDLINGKIDNYYNNEWRQAAARKSEITIIPLAVKGFSLRDNYFKAFEKIIGGKTSGISLEDANAFNNLQKAIDKHLNV